MSQPVNRETDPERGDGGIQAVPVHDRHELPQHQSTRPPQGESNFGDSSGPLFSLYSKIAEEDDNKMTERWQKDADGILIFTGLFSAAVSVLLAVSVLDLRQNPQNISAFYLANIYQILAHSNVTVPPTSFLSTIATPPPFSPPRYAIWVNSLWSLSLVISLTCALLATSLHQWSRRYIRLTQPSRCGPEKRARLRAFFANGLDKMHLPLAVEALPALIHLSLLLFFTGLVIFLFNTNHSVFIPVIWWIGVFIAVYIWMTVMPIFRHDSPYYAPLSSTAWSFHAFLLYVLFKALAFITYRFRCLEIWRRFDDLIEHYRDRMLGDVSKAAEETALEQSSDIDLGILDWIMDALGEDEALEKFFEAIPGFFNSQVVKNLKESLPDMVRWKFVVSLGIFLSRNLSSNSINEEVKIRRLVICMNTAKAICSSYDTEDIIQYLFHLRFDQLPLSFRTAEILTHWYTSTEHHIYSDLSRTVADIFLFVWERDDRWTALAKDKFGMSEDVLRDNIAHGDNSVLLAILIHVTRQVIHTDLETWQILSSLSKFDIHDTIPGLQHEFCALWNEIVLKARSDGPSSDAALVLRSIRHLYVALHQGTDSDADRLNFNPLCDIAAHHPHSSVARLIHGSINDPQQADEAKSARHAQGFPSSSSSSTTDPVHVSPKVTSVTASSIHDSLQTVTLDQIQLVSTDVPRIFPESSLSTTNLTKNIVRNNPATSDVPTNEIGETSHTPSATFVTFRHPGPVPVTVTPSIVASLSVDQHDHNKRQDITAPHDASDITRVTSEGQLAVYPNTTSTNQRNKESAGVPPTTYSTTVPDPQSSLIVDLPSPDSVILTKLPSSEESVLVQPDPLSPPLGSPSSTLTTAQSLITPQSPSVLDVYVTTSIDSPQFARAPRDP